MIASFHPAGTLLASNGWEGRLRLWDPVLGRPLLSLTGGSALEFSQDGRIVIALEDKLTTYQVDPALEYRTFAHASREPMSYDGPSIRHDGRVLAVGTNRGVVLWDLARGTELAFLPIGNAWHLMFEPSGDLITSGSIGVQRWPVQLDPDRGEFRIGPPRRLPLPAGPAEIAEDRSGRIVAMANHTYAYVATPERTIRVGPLDDCRSVAVSPDGQWLATGSHLAGGAQVWRITRWHEGGRAAHRWGHRRSLQPRWEVADDGQAPCRLWEVGTWREVRQIGGRRVAASPPTAGWWSSSTRAGSSAWSRLETGRTLARLESPDLCGVGMPTFSPDGSRLVVTTNDRPTRPCTSGTCGPSASTSPGWASTGTPRPIPKTTSASPRAPPLPPLQVDFGKLADRVEQFSEPPSGLIERYTARLASDPNDADAYHHRALALANLRRYPEAIDDWTQAIRLRPDDARPRAMRAAIYESLHRYEPAIADLEAALARNADQPAIRERLGMCCNNRASELATGPESTRDPRRALPLARRAVELTPAQNIYLNTLGVVQYRVGQYAEAIATLERSLAAGGGQTDAFDLFFLAMAHHRLGHREQARAAYDRAVRWLEEQKSLAEQYAKELAAFRAEAESVLGGPAGKLPDDVFAPLLWNGSEITSRSVNREQSPSEGPAVLICTSNHQKQAWIRPEGDDEVDTWLGTRQEVCCVPRTPYLSPTVQFRDMTPVTRLCLPERSECGRSPTSAASGAPSVARGSPPRGVGRHLRDRPGAGVCDVRRRAVDQRQRDSPRVVSTEGGT